MLKVGSRVAVVAPSGVFDPRRLAAGVAMIRDWGLDVVESPNLHSKHRYLAGSVAERTSDLVWALTTPDVDAVWFARGGYGTIQCLSGLPFEKMDGRPVIGFSDATALLCAMHCKGVMGGIHGPVLHSLADLPNQSSIDTLRKLLFDGTSALMSGQHLCGPKMKVSGAVIGGNLCVMASLMGTPWSVCAEGSIVVIEDIAEPAYKIDRMLTQLVLAGAFDGVRGIALGEFRGCAVPSKEWTLNDLFVEVLGPLGVPVVGGLPIGHGEDNCCWAYGVEGRLSPDGLHVG